MAIKKIEEGASPVYRHVLMPDEQAKKLAMQRGKMIVLAMGMGQSGLPMREADPFRDNFPCNYCEWKSKCIADGDGYGLMLPPIPESYKTRPVEVAV